MSVPNRLAIVEQVNQAEPRFLRWNTRAACVEFLQRVRAAMPPGERWGFLTKSEGEAGHTLPNGQRIALDVLALPDGNRVDVISGSDNNFPPLPPVPAGPAWQVVPPELWRPSNVYIDGSAWPIFDSGTPGGGQTTVAELGIGWFGLLRDFQDRIAEIPANAAYIRERLKPKVWRIFLDLEGISHIKGNDPDVWRDAGIDGRASNWTDLFQRALDFAGNAGEQLWCTVYGGRNHFPLPNSRRIFHDRIVQAAQGRWSAIYGFEMMNEYRVNKWDEQEVRDAGRDLRSKVPAGTRIALSSPRLAHSYTDAGTEATNEEMAECINDLYGGSDHAGANVMTIHKMRDARSKWADPFSYNPFSLGLPLIDNEPPGDGASAGGDTSDPVLIAKDYKRTSAAGWSLRIEHPASWCVWRGNLPAEYPLRQYRNIADVPNIAETFRLLREVRDGGTVEPGEPEMPKKPYPGDAAFDIVGVQLFADYLEKGNAPDPQMGRWFARTIWDHTNGDENGKVLTLEESIKKHRVEWRGALGLPPAA